MFERKIWTLVAKQKKVEERLLKKDQDNRLMENPLIFRQGDVILKQMNATGYEYDTKKLKTLPVQEDKKIAFGEITGHSHKFRSQDQVLVYKDPATNEPDLVVVEPGATAVLEHQEHLP
jgi:hypothetical protein